MQTSESSILVALKNGIWLFGIASWLFRITDRSIASFSDGYLSALDIIQLFTAAFFFMSWLYLKLEQNLSNSSINEQQFP